MDDINLEKLTLPSALKLTSEDNKRLPRHKPGEKFLKGPVPWNWISAATKLSGKAPHVAIALWFLAGIKKSHTIALSGKLLEDIGVKRNAAYRGLTVLEEAGLISVNRHRGRLSIVTLLDMKG
jgi:hypothetical protein